MRNFFAAILIFILTGCAEKLDKAELHLLNGYWEIEKVVFPDGEKKEYQINSTIDFFEHDGTHGFRKKVQPLLDGSFETSDDAASFTILETNGVFRIHYKNELSEWEEQIVSLSATNFTVVNKENIRYHYKKFQAKVQN